MHYNVIYLFNIINLHNNFVHRHNLIFRNLGGVQERYQEPDAEEIEKVRCIESIGR